MLNAYCRTIPAALAGVAVATAISILPCEVQAQGGNVASVSTLRETVESDHVSGTGTNGVAILKPRGTVILRKQGIKQIFDVDVRSLSSSLNPSNTGWGVWLGMNPTLRSNDIVSLLCQLDRLVVTGEHFAVSEQGLGEAPQFLSVDVPDLNDLTNRSIGVGFPMMAGTTNFVVKCVVWAPIPELLPRSAKTSFNKHALLSLPVPPTINGQMWVPAPKARGKINLRYSGTTGQSLFEVDTKNLLGGHSDTVWMTVTTTNDVAYPDCITNSASSCLTNIAPLTLSILGKGGRYLRDTKVGDSLPLQFGYASDLSNHLLVIEDESRIIYLQGVIP